MNVWLKRMLPLLAVLGAVVGCGGASPGADAGGQPAAGEFPARHPGGDGLARAVFAGGCFWCMEPPFEKLDGVVSVQSGYAGPAGRQPSYAEVSRGTTRHVEAVEVVYAPAKIAYDKLLETFWRNIDPTQEDGQFADRGPQYRTAIYTASDDERAAAERSMAALAASGKFDKPIATKILELEAFFPAEEHHQDYHRKNPAHYNAYKVGSGRAGFLERTWGASSR